MLKKTIIGFMLALFTGTVSVLPDVSQAATCSNPETPVFGCPCPTVGMTKMNDTSTAILACLNAGAAGNIWQNMGQTTVENGGGNSYVAEGTNKCHPDYQVAYTGYMVKSGYTMGGSNGPGYTRVLSISQSRCISTEQSVNEREKPIVDFHKSCTGDTLLKLGEGCGGHIFSGIRCALCVK